jgi:hypothetical protein
LTSPRQAKIDGNSSNIASLATTSSIHHSNIGSLNQSINTIETDVNTLTSSLTDNSSRISTVSGDLASNVSRIITVSGDLTSNATRISNTETNLASNVNRISTLESAGSGTVWTTSGSDIYYNSGDVAIGLTGAESKLHIYGSDNPLMLQSQRSPYPKLSYDFSGSNAENFQFYDHHGSGRGFLYGRKYTTGTNPNTNAGWHFYGNDTTLALRIDGSANVGIGTTSPGGKLEIQSSSAGQTAVIPPTTQLVLTCDDANAGDPGDLGAGLTFKQRWFNSNGTHVATGGIYGVKTVSNGSYGGGLAFFRGPSGGNSLTEAMRIKHEGTVGIGTTNPKALTHAGKYSTTSGSHLTIPSSNMGSSASFPESTNLWLGKRTSSSGEDYWGMALGTTYAGSSYIQTLDKSNSSYYNLLLQPNGGNVGIGITTPDVPLHVAASSSATVGTTHRWISINAFSGQNVNDAYDRKFGYSIYNTTGGSYTYSIRASGAISCPHFIISSDERIKKDIVDVEDDEALVKLRKLHPKKYRFIDESERGAHQIYGFLANEVQEVLPEAIVEHPEEVPSIYQFANATSSNVITFSGDFDTSQLESNVLVVVGIDQVKHTLTVDEIIDSTSVRVIEDLSAFSGSLDEHGNVVTESQTLSITPEEFEELEDKNGFKPISDDSNVISEYTKTTTTYVGDQLFVYGERVNDFKHLQESAISTLSTAALQEVDRQLQAEKARNDTLESRIEALEAQLALS